MKRNFKINLFVGKFFIYLLLIIVLIIVTYPVIWTILTSLNESTSDVYKNILGLPENPSFQSYIKVWGQGDFSLYFMNSIIITFFSIIGIVFLSSLAGYGFARYKFKGSNIFFNLFTISLVVAPASIVIAQYKIIQTLNLLDSYLGVIFIYFSWTVLGVMLTRIAFQEIPQDLIDAARIDGCSELRIYWRICLPLIKPTLATVGIFNFIYVWNDFLWPLVILQNPKLQTIMVGIFTFRGQYYSNWEILSAGINIGMLPILIIYLIFQRFFIRGLTLGSIK